MNEDEKLLWMVTYAAATIARETDPGFKADNAVIRFQMANSPDIDDSGPEQWPDEDVPF